MPIREGRRRNPNNWNNYEVTEPTLFTRGFTGHEHIGGYGLINMNGRVYDPRLGRFLSPDPYVQAPDFSQSFNRYSYVWNNPLKYTDPDGELVWLAPVIVGAIIGGYSGYKIGKANGATGWGMAGYIFGGAAIGGVAGYTGFSLFASGMAAGTAAGMSGISAGFNAGLLSGMASGAITGGGMAALGGGSFIDVLNGATIGAWMGGVAGGFTGAIGGGMQNMRDGMNFWGTRLSKDTSLTTAFLGGVDVDPNMIYRQRYGIWPYPTIYGRNLLAAAAAREGMGAAANFIFQAAMYGTIAFSTVGISSAVGGAIWRMGARQVVSRGSSLLKGGKTFTQYRSLYWSSRAKPTLDPIINPNTGQVWKQYVELHHRFIPQRASWAPNWLKNNGLNLKPVSSLRHAQMDPYRARFAPGWIKKMYNLKW